MAAGFLDIHCKRPRRAEAVEKGCLEVAPSASLPTMPAPFPAATRISVVRQSARHSATRRRRCARHDVRSVPLLPQKCQPKAASRQSRFACALVNAIIQPI